ncbi:MAG: YitT family protein [Inhella sp.]
MTRHRWHEDLQALVTGTLLATLGLSLFEQAGLMSGGVVGLALLARHVTELPFGLLYFAINLPFYWLAWRRLGLAFTLKTLAAVSLLSLLSTLLPGWLQIASVQPLFASLGGGLLIGVGFVVLFRHRASLGGLNVLVLWCQDRFGWRAGWLQLGIDASILLAATPWLSSQQFALSVLAAAAMNAALALNHRPGRYLGG